MDKGDRGTIFHQRKFITNIVESIGQQNSKPSSFPLANNLNLLIETTYMLEDGEPYRRLISKMLYLNLTRP